MNNYQKQVRKSWIIFWVALGIGVLSFIATVTLYAVTDSEWSGFAALPGAIACLSGAYYFQPQKSAIRYSKAIQLDREQSDGE